MATNASLNIDINNRGLGSESIWEIVPFLFVRECVCGRGLASKWNSVPKSAPPFSFLHFSPEELSVFPFSPLLNKKIALNRMQYIDEEQTKIQ